MFGFLIKGEVNDDSVRLKAKYVLESSGPKGQDALREVEAEIRSSMEQLAVAGV